MHETTAPDYSPGRPAVAPAGVSAERVRLSAVRRIEALLDEISDLERTRRLINIAVWGIALGVMVYGAINVTGLLIDHGVWMNVAWLLSFMIDLAMCVALLGDRVLHRYGRRDGWVTALRWMTAAMTLILNTAKPALGQDWVGVGIHTVGPVLLMLVAEGAGSFQRQLTEIIQDLQTQMADAETTTNQHASKNLDAPAPVLVPAPIRLTGSVSDSDGPTISVALTGHSPLYAGGSAVEVSTNGPSSVETEMETASEDSSDAPTASAPVVDGDHSEGLADEPTRQDAPGAHMTLRAAMWGYWEECRMHRRTVTGADLDRKFGTNNYGRRVINDWVRHGQLTETEVAAARSGWPAEAA